MMRALPVVLVALLIAVGCTKKSSAAKPAEPTVANTAAQATNNKTTVELEIVRQEQPDDAMGPGTEEQQQLLIRAKTAFLTEDWDEAEARFKDLTALGPVSGPQVTAFIALGQIYNDSERQDEAQALYTTLLEKAPTTPEVHFVMARTLAEQGETTRAIKEYEQTITLQPDYLQAMVEVGGLYTKAGRKEEAERILYKYEQKVYKLAGELEKDDTHPERKLELLEIFSFVNDDRANQAVAKNVLDPDPVVRERAIWLAVDLKLGSVAPKLRILAEGDPSRRVQLAAREALRTLDDAPTAGAKPTFVRDKK